MIRRPITLTSIYLGLTIGVITTLATVLGLAGDLWWRFELLDHFRWQYCWLLLLPLAIGIWQRQRWAVVWLVPLAINGALILALAWPSARVGSTTETLTVFHANIDHKNPQPAAAIEYVNQQTADIIFLQEITPTTLPQIVQGLTHYQLVAAEPKTNSHGSAMFVPLGSSLRILSKQIIQEPNYSQRPLLTVDIQLGERVVSLMSIHITRPGTAGASRFQNIEFQAIADWARRQMAAKKAVVIIGDLNSTPWSQRVNQMLKRGNLQNSQQGYVWQMTWPGDLPIFLQIAIDHCLHSRDLGVIQRSTGPYIGSDHLPLQVTLGERS
ncbi:MAG: endonuclease/exonuclease/phosphatase family protein [Cyanobacteria bacterium J06642_11]